MRRRAKVDDNQAQIVSEFRARGCFVQSLAAVGAGVPDLLVGKGGKWILVEIKDGSKCQSARQLTPKEAEWILAVRNRGPVHVVETPADVSKVLGAQA